MHNVCARPASCMTKHVLVCAEAQQMSMSALRTVCLGLPQLHGDRAWPVDGDHLQEDDHDGAVVDDVPVLGRPQLPCAGHLQQVQAR